MKKRHLYIVVLLVVALVFGFKISSAASSMNTTIEGKTQLTWEAKNRSQADAEVAINLDGDTGMVLNITLDAGLSFIAKSYPTETTPNVGSFIKKVEQKNNYLRYYFIDGKKGSIKIDYKIALKHGNLWKDENLKMISKFESDSNLDVQELIPINFIS